MKSWNEFTSELTEDELLVIVSEHQELRKNGVIGDCFLRSKANKWCEEISNSSLIIIIMNDLANYAYRYFAEKYFELSGIKI